jgi:hypothetical protein
MRHFFTFFLLQLSSCASLSHHSCYKEERDSVLLEGSLSFEESFGPPNFGQQKENDLRLKVPIIRLDSPLNLCARSADNVNYPAIDDVREVQLIEIQGKNRAGHSLNRKRWKGQLMRAQSGHHVRSVSLVVN